VNDRLSNLLQKLQRQGTSSVTELASKAWRVAGESTGAAVAFRDCDRVGSGARAMNGRPIVRNQGRIEIGEDFRVVSKWIPVELATGKGGTISIGDQVQINYGTMISAEKRVAIGNRVMIGNHCIIADTEVPGTPPVDDSPAREISIGDGAWLAVRVTVLPGAKIGAGAIITAGSVVAGEIPAGVVAGGIPARVLRGGQPQGEAGAATAHTNGTPHSHSPRADVVAAAARPAEREVAYRGTIISDFTIAELATQLPLTGDGPAAEAEVAPFGQVVQALVQGPIAGHADFAVVWTRPEAVVPSFAKVVSSERVDEAALFAEVDAFCELVAKAAPAYRAVFVPTWTRPAYERGFGLLDLREGGATRALQAMNHRLAEKLAATSGVYVLDAHRWLMLAGRNAYPPKSWYLGKVPFQAEVFAEAARDIHAALGAIAGRTRKLLVLDLDDTMWGGIVGDVGWENLRLGGHDGLGEAFVDFQRAVKALSRRGIVLAIVSKNEEATALEAIRRHPEMILREDDFVAWRINWRDKAQNILDIVKELNLGLQSVVFIDDNPVERARVREALPEVFVPEWPEDKHLYRSTLASLRCFDVASLTKEDAGRTALYAAERKREQLQQSVGSIDEWLEGLGIRVLVQPLAAQNLQRTAQLLNKTNQLNLSTRRLTDNELVEWAKGPGRKLWAISVSDRFGDAGLTGIVSVEVEGHKAAIVDFVLSCRVMGRRVEAAMVHVAVDHARAAGAQRVEARYLKTSKNKPTLDFWTTSGWKVEEGDVFAWDATAPFELPRAITLELTP
jgi:FkbH-like protein